MSQIAWHEDFDSDDNSIWSGTSPYHDAGVFFKWRLMPTLMKNQVAWITDHDSELGDSQERWDTIEQAKAAIQDQHDQILDYESTQVDDDQ